MLLNIRKFISFPEIIKSKADYFVFKRILQREMYYLEDEESVKLHSKFSNYYLQKDNRWIIAYNNYLNELSDYYLNQLKDYETASYVIETIIKLSDFILNSGITISQRNKEKIDQMSSNKLKKHKSTLKAIQLIYDDKAIEYIENFLNKIPLEPEDSFDELYFITLIIRQIDYNDIDELLIELIKKLGIKGHFKVKNFLSDFFDKLIHSRIRYFEDLLFLEVFSNIEVKQSFYKERNNTISIAKEYFSCHLNLLKDDQKEFTVIYKSFIKSLKFIHYEKGLDSVVQSINVLTNLNDFEEKVFKEINWNKGVDDYLCLYESNFDDFDIRYIGKTLAFEIEETIHASSLHRLSCVDLKTIDFFLPVYFSKERLNIGNKVNAVIFAFDNYTNSGFIKEPKLIKSKLNNEDLIIGDTYSAIITNIRDFGIFIKVDNNDGFIPIKNISNARVDNEHIHDIFSINDNLSVKLIDVNIKKQYVFSIRDAFKKKDYKTGEESVGTVISFGKKHVNLQLTGGGSAILPEYEINFEKEFSIDYFFHFGEKIKCKIKKIDDGKIFVKPIKEEIKIGNYLGKFLYKIDDLHYFKLCNFNTTVSSKLTTNFRFNRTENIQLSISKIIKKNEVTIDFFHVAGEINRNKLKYDLNIEKGYSYENLSFYKESLEEKINFLSISKHYYSVGRSARAYYVKIFSDYIRLITKVTSTNESNDSIKELNTYAIQILSDINKENLSLMKFPIIRQFVNTLKGITQLNQNHFDSSVYFAENTFFDSHARTEKLSKLILAYNLLDSNSNQRKDFWKIIKESIIVALSKLNFDANELSEANELSKIIQRALNSNENKKLEFKASVFIPVLGKGQKNAISKLDLEKAEDQLKYNSILDSIKKPEITKEIQNTFLKTLAAFANTNGGVIIIGIDEDINGNPIQFGIDEDLKKFKGSVDEYMKAIDQLINNKISKEFGNHYWLKHCFYNEKQYLITEVKKSSSPIFSKIKNESDFFIRENTQTISLSNEETYKFISEWFNK